jgi:hypothetical protein
MAPDYRAYRFSLQLARYQEAALYDEYAEKFKSETPGLRRGLHMLFADAAASANNRAYEARQYGYFAAIAAETPQECETDAQALIAVLKRRREMPRAAFREAVRFYADKTLNAPRHEMKLSEREYRQIMQARAASAGPAAP